MVQTIIAKQDFVIKQGTKTVRILKGDSFEVYGQVFAVQSILVDLNKYYSMFNVQTTQDKPTPMYLRAIHDMTIVSPVSGRKAVIKADDVLTIWSDVIVINQVVFNVADYMYNFERIYKVAPNPVTDLAFDAEQLTVTWTGTTGKYTYSIDNGDKTTIDTASVDVSELELGEHAISVTQIDTVFNTESTPVSINFTLEQQLSDGPKEPPVDLTDPVDGGDNGQTEQPAEGGDNGQTEQPAEGGDNGQTEQPAEGGDNEPGDNEQDPSDNPI